MAAPSEGSGLKAGNVASCGYRLDNSFSFFVEMSMLIDIR